MDRSLFARRALSCLAFLLAASILLGAAGAVLRPAQVDYGSTWRAYRAEPRNTIDVLYFGSSYAYCDLDPVEVYRQSRLTGYVMAGSEQTMSLTYWYLREALKTQSPQAVVIEPTGVFFDRYQNYTQTNVVYMPMSDSKLGAVFTAAQPELRVGLLFDLWFYHSRWKDLKPRDVRRAFSLPKTDDRKGFTATSGMVQEPVLSRNSRPIEEEPYTENLRWLLKCVSLCEEKGVRPVLLFNPTYGQAREEQYLRLEREVAEASQNAVFVNWADKSEEFGLEPTVHYHDGGHLNQVGAARYAQFLAELLTDELGIVPMAQTPENAQAWQQAVLRRDEG